MQRAKAALRGALSATKADHSVSGRPKFPVVISRRSHPIPSRTRKLSSLEPMVLLGRPSGRGGRCRDLLIKGPREESRGLLSFVFSALALVAVVTSSGAR